MQTFLELEQRRLARGLTRKAVYERAAIGKDTWTRLSRAPNACQVGTLEKIAAALDALTREQEEAA